jgi:hypothetical protein
VVLVALEGFLALGVLLRSLFLLFGDTIPGIIDKCCDFE